MLSIRSILVMPSQCSICGSLVNKGYRKHRFVHIHPASVLETAYPARVSGFQQKQLLVLANLDTSNVLRPLEIFTSTLKTVSLLLHQERESRNIRSIPRLPLVYAKSVTDP